LFIFFIIEYNPQGNHSDHLGATICENSFYYKLHIYYKLP